MNKFLQIFNERGFLHQCTDEEALGKLDSFTAYIGFDCTADSLHVGSLLQIMILRWLKKTGNTPIILLGGATTKIGDPSGKDESRPVITQEQIDKNKAGIRKVFDKFGLGDCKFVDNSEWLDKINYLDLMQEIGRLMSVNRMIAKESVKQRLDRDSEMTFLEFNYMVLQAYDFVELAKKYDCNVQIGGSDQWGNIVEGIELYRRKLVDKKPKPTLSNTVKGFDLLVDGKVIRSFKDEQDAKEAHQQELQNWKAANYIFGLTTPLITTSSGAKMGKSAGGAIWLDENKLSANEYYQFWRNADDADVISFLKFFTELPLAEIDAMKKWEGSADINEAKKILAFEATKLCHGEAAAQEAQQTAIAAFEQGGTDGLPEIEMAAGEVAAFALFAQAGLADSNGKARKLIQGGGARIDDEKIDDENQIITITDGMKLSSGKKNHLIIKVK